jgi:hypothetical protein
MISSNGFCRKKKNSFEKKRQMIVPTMSAIKQRMRPDLSSIRCCRGVSLSAVLAVSTSTQVLLEIVQRAPALTDDPPQSICHLGQILGPDKNKRQGQDKKDFSYTQSEHEDNATFKSCAP